MCGHVWIDCNRLRLQFVAFFFFPIYLKIELYILFSHSLSLSLSLSLHRHLREFSQGRRAFGPMHICFHLLEIEQKITICEMQILYKL